MRGTWVEGGKGGVTEDLCAKGNESWRKEKHPNPMKSVGAQGFLLEHPRRCLTACSVTCLFHGPGAALLCGTPIRTPRGDNSKKQTCTVALRSSEAGLWKQGVKAYFAHLVLGRMPGASGSLRSMCSCPDSLDSSWGDTAILLNLDIFLGPDYYRTKTPVPWGISLN